MKKLPLILLALSASSTLAQPCVWSAEIHVVDPRSGVTVDVPYENNAEIDFYGAQECAKLEQGALDAELEIYHSEICAGADIATLAKPSLPSNWSEFKRGRWALLTLLWERWPIATTDFVEYDACMARAWDFTLTSDAVCSEVAVAATSFPDVKTCMSTFWLLGEDPEHGAWAIPSEQFVGVFPADMPLATPGERYEEVRHRTEDDVPSIIFMIQEDKEIRSVPP